MTRPTAPLPDEELTAIGERHQPYEHVPFGVADGIHETYCKHDQSGWPCDTATVAAALRAERAARARLRANVEAIHPDGEPCVCVAAVLEMIDDPAITVGGPHWDSNLAPATGEGGES